MEQTIKKMLSEQMNRQNELQIKFGFLIKFYWKNELVYE